MFVGSSLKKVFVPAKKAVHHLQVECRYPKLPKKGVTAFAYINHAHLLGRKLWTTLERKNKYVRDVGCDTAYDFDLQQILPFEKAVTILPTDTLRANCVYDSSSRSALTKGGDETTNEMCINFLVRTIALCHALSLALACARALARTAACLELTDSVHTCRCTTRRCRRRTRRAWSRPR